MNAVRTTIFSWIFVKNDFSRITFISWSAKFKNFIELQFLNTYDIDKSLATNLSVIEAVIEIHSSNIVAHEY